jgi:two-component system nitrate/nitrite response regulator NarL
MEWESKRVKRSGALKNFAVGIQSAPVKFPAIAHLHSHQSYPRRATASTRGTAMARRTATVIIESHLLVREALESLIKKYRYRVVRSGGCTVDVENSMAGGDPELVILGAESTDDAIAEAVSIRKLWPNSKIVLLFEHASVVDFQKLLMSEVDGCVPLFASPEALIRTLDLVTIEDTRVVVTASVRNPAIRPSPKGKARQAKTETEGAFPDNIERDVKPMNVINMPSKPTVNGAMPSNGHDGGPHWTASLPESPRLSERETQILDGLVQGHANKVIARTCAITEATVKVHMKAILRKIRVANRTQAAVWALEHSHSIQQIKDAC